MASLSPPITVHLTPRQMAWLDGRRQIGFLSRSAALRVAIDELILQEQGSRRSKPRGSGPHKSAPKPARLRSASPVAEA